MVGLVAAGALATAIMTASADSISVSAKLPADELTAGGQYTVEVELTLPEAWSSSKAGIPKPLLQIDVPDGVELLGQRFEGYEQLSRHEFLEEPFERLMAPEGGSFDIRLTEALAPDATIGVNVVVYLGDNEETKAMFVRRRIELPVKAGATAQSDAPADQSGWGVNGTLAIGDLATDFELPRADGSTVRLSDYIGKKNILLTTYRAFW